MVQRATLPEGVDADSAPAKRLRGMQLGKVKVVETALERESGAFKNVQALSRSRFGLASLSTDSNWDGHG